MVNPRHEAKESGGTAAVSAPRKAAPISNEINPAAAERIEPGPRNKAAIDEALQAYADRPMRAYIQWGDNGDGVMRADAPHSDVAGHSAHLASAFGTTSTAFLTTQLGALEWATRGRGDKQGATASEINSGLAIVQAVDPENEMEAALAVQMAGCHSLATEMLGRARHADRVEQMERYGALAVKLQRTFTAQLDTLARLRGKGQQTVRVEHVTVEAGAQAIVGDVHHHGGARPANAQAHKPVEQPAMPGENPLGNGVSLPLDAKRPMPHARRYQPRRTKGQPQCAQAREVQP